MVSARHERPVAGALDRRADALVVGGDAHAARTARLRALAHVDHHGLAAQIGERLAGNAGRPETRRDDDVKTQATSSSGGSLRASSSSITGMPSFTGKPRRSALHTSSAASLRYTSGPLHRG